MGAQMKYFVYYPNDGGRTGNAIAWDFLVHNQVKAAEATRLWFTSEVERLEMANKKRINQAQPMTNKNDEASWGGFANIELTPDDKQAILGGILDGESTLDIISEMVGTGHKITLSYDADRDTINVSATGKYKYCRNAGLTLTAFGRSLGDTLTVLAYKHDVIAKGDWAKVSKKSYRDEDFG